MNPVSHTTSLISASQPAPRSQKIVRAAQEFEAALLNTLLGSLEQSFSAMPGKKVETGSDHYHYLGMQTLASSLAAGGGIGIAKLISRSLATSGGNASSATQEKSPTRGASLGRPF